MNVQKNRSEKYQKIVKRFVADLPSRFEEMKEYFDQKNWQGLQEEAHKLKGLGTSMGFPVLTEINEKICDNCINQHYDEIPPLIESLNQEILQIKNNTSQV